MKYKANSKDVLAHLPREKLAKQALTRLGDIYMFDDKNHILTSPGLYKSLGQLFEAETDSYMYGGFKDLTKTLESTSTHTKNLFQALPAGGKTLFLGL